MSDILNPGEIAAVDQALAQANRLLDEIMTAVGFEPADPAESYCKLVRALEYSRQPMVERCVLAAAILRLADGSR